MNDWKDKIARQERDDAERNPFDTLRENPFVVTWNGSLLDAMVAACSPEEFGGTTPDAEDETR